MSGRVLIAGVGNVFLGDDGFGVEVATRLRAPDVRLPAGVEVADVGIRGVHLAYQLLDGYHAVVLVDTVQRGEPPGTLYLLEHDLDQPPSNRSGVLDAHGMDPTTVLALLEELAAGTGVHRPVERMLVLGCEPASLDERLDLSEPVAAAVERAVPALIDLAAELVKPENANGGNHHDPDTAGGVGDRDPRDDSRVAP